jgi:hypothetical protein
MPPQPEQRLLREVPDRRDSAADCCAARLSGHAQIGHSVLTTAVDPPAEKTRQNEP